MTWLQSLLGGKETKPPAPTSSATVQREDGNVYVIRIGGVLNRGTTDRIQTFAVQDIARGVNVKMLLILDGFQGWRKGDDWGDIDFFSRYEAGIAKIAAVGGEEWKTSTLLFLGAGHRTGEVRYFAPGQEAAARAWLAT
jgi:hypothetical protein